MAVASCYGSTLPSLLLVVFVLQAHTTTWGILVKLDTFPVEYFGEFQSIGNKKRNASIRAGL